jgi:hypothetical protein
MFNKHLKDSNVTYTQHMRWAIVAGIRLIYAGVASIIHAVVPAWFSATAAKTVIDLYHTRLKDHPNIEYQNYIQESKKDKL